LSARASIEPIPQNERRDFRNQKPLTFHLSRHSFATTLTFLIGAPIEKISKLLAHAKFTQSMIYARVMKLKIGTDLTPLQKKLDSSFQI
jgi:integrase/recombinase XerD